MTDAEASGLVRKKSTLKIFLYLTFTFFSVFNGFVFLCLFFFQIGVFAPS